MLAAAAGSSAAACHASHKLSSHCPNLHCAALQQHLPHRAGLREEAAAEHQAEHLPAEQLDSATPAAVAEEERPGRGAATLPTSATRADGGARALLCPQCAVHASCQPSARSRCSRPCCASSAVHPSLLTPIQPPTHTSTGVDEELRPRPSALGAPIGAALLPTSGGFMAPSAADTGVAPGASPSQGAASATSFGTMGGAFTARVGEGGGAAESAAAGRPKGLGSRIREALLPRSRTQVCACGRARCVG